MSKDPCEYYFGEGKPTGMEHESLKNLIDAWLFLYWDEDICVRAGIELRRRWTRARRKPDWIKVLEQN